MSKVTQEALLAGIIFGDVKNEEYIYLPGGEVGSENPFCIFESKSRREDIPLEQAALLVQRLSLKPCQHPALGKRAY
ncbi:MAG: hypothetical protein SPI71_01120 [Acidaminococcaceae bacterium]|nr:hypothetical protein [Acidaminococcaceae bacterium]